jgi:hypothetical protein
LPCDARRQLYPRSPARRPLPIGCLRDVPRRTRVCFFQSAERFKTSYATFGFSDAAKLDEGAMWPVGFALKELTAAAEARIGALVKKAVR